MDGRVVGSMREEGMYEESCREVHGSAGRSPVVCGVCWRSDGAVVWSDRRRMTDQPSGCPGSGHRGREDDSLLLAVARSRLGISIGAHTE